MEVYKEYTFADVATRNGRGTQPVWIVYKDSVFDLTKYIQEHPGGVEAILDMAGKDATSTFDDVGHSGDARSVMMRHKIGIIVQEERRYDANGKKIKRIVSAAGETSESRGCLNIITCGLIG